MQFPKQLEKQVAELIQFNRAPTLESLVNQVYESLKKEFKSHVTGSPRAKSIKTTKPSVSKVEPRDREQSNRSPLSKNLLRIWIVKNAIQHGPEGATKFVWVVKPAVVSRYKMATDVPQSISKDLMASVKLKHSRKRALESAGHDDQREESQDDPKKKKVARTSESRAAASSKSDLDRLVVPKTVEQIERQYPPQSLGRIISSVLIENQPKALSPEEIFDKAIALGKISMKDGEPTFTARSIGKALIYDTNFVRLERGRYSLHAFHPHIEILKRSSRLQPKGGKTDNTAKKKKSLLRKVEQNAECIKAAVLQQKEKYENCVRSVRETKLELEKALEDENNFAKTRKFRFNASSNFQRELLARFELPESQRVWKGEPDDRKGMLEHRQKLQAKMKEIEKKKQSFIDSERNKENEQFAQLKKNRKMLEEALSSAEKAEKDAQNNLEKLELEAANIDRRLDAEKVRASRLLEKQNATRTKEKRKSSVTYPIEDLDLHQELAAGCLVVPDVFPPNSWKSKTESIELAQSFIISDFFFQFGKHIGVKSLNYFDLVKAITNFNRAIHRPLCECSEEVMIASQTLVNLYENILRYFLLNIVAKKKENNTILDENSGEHENSIPEEKWLNVLSDATWPEILYLVIHDTATRDEFSFNRPSAKAIVTVSLINSRDGLHKLEMNHHINLLQYFTDLLIDTETIRNVVQKRGDAMIGALKRARADVLEERRKLKELNQHDVLKEKLEAATVKTTSNNEVIRPPMLAALSDNANDQASISRGMISTRCLNSSKISKPPISDLPVALREYRGDPNDEESKEKFYRKQKEARRKLEKDRIRWFADEQRRIRREEAALRAAAEEKKEIEKKREASSAAIVRTEEELEEKLEKNAIRRKPLGFDRHHRQYWYNLGGNRSIVYVEDRESNLWGEYSSVESVENLLKSLDRRGIREKRLSEAIEKRMHSIILGMRRAQNLEKGNTVRHNSAENTSENSEGNLINKRESKDCIKITRKSSRKRQPVQMFSVGEDKEEEKQRKQGTSNIVSQRFSVGRRRHAQFKMPLDGSFDNITIDVLKLLFDPLEFAAASMILRIVPALYDEIDKGKYLVGLEAYDSKAQWNDWISSFNSSTWNKYLGRDRSPHMDNSSAYDAFIFRSQASQAILRIENLFFDACTFAAKKQTRPSSNNIPSSVSTAEDTYDHSNKSEERDQKGYEAGLETTPVKSEQEESNALHPVLWESSRDRELWRQDVMQAQRLTKLAFSVSMLQLKSANFFETIENLSEEKIMME